ncbi:hypothetical protein HYS48_04300 [Candidatus Woesearchaeota archaeon]|nr:hypothetical protein [Candidatus Woesearchaeota archaeon]
MNPNLKIIGIAVVVFSLLLLLTLSFVKTKLDAQAVLVCEAYHAEYKARGEECPGHSGDTSWLLTTAFGFSFLLLGTGLYLIFLSKASGIVKKEFKEINLEKLNAEEKSIYEKIKAKGGSMYQSDLIKETGLTKVKITRILDKMEMDGILERKRRGMTNIIVLQ